MTNNNLLSDFKEVLRISQKNIEISKIFENFGHENHQNIIFHLQTSNACNFATTGSWAVKF